MTQSEHFRIKLDIIDVCNYEGNWAFYDIKVTPDLNKDELEKLLAMLVANLLFFS